MAHPFLAIVKPIIVRVLRCPFRWVAGWQSVRTGCHVWFKVSVKQRRVPSTPSCKTGCPITHWDVTAMLDRYRRCGIPILDRCIYLVTTLSGTALGCSDPALNCTGFLTHQNVCNFFSGNRLFAASLSITNISGVQ